MLATRLSALTQLGILQATFAIAAWAGPPNVVFFLADDLGWRDLGCYGSQFYETPNLDALADSGARFTQAYAACPVCSPTRASILTGKYPVRMRVTDYISPGRWKPAAIMATQHRDATGPSMTTACHSGKRPWQRRSRRAATPRSSPESGTWARRGSGPKIRASTSTSEDSSMAAPGVATITSRRTAIRTSRTGPAGEHLPDRLARETCEFIANHRDEPFLAYLSFYSVHTPLMTTGPLERKYTEKAGRLTIFGPRFIRDGFRDARQVQDHAVYAGMVEALDTAVGKVLHALESNGLESSTIVVFMSDNGGLSTSEGSPTANLPLRAGKGWLYEGGIREPMIIRAPGVTSAGSAIDTPVTSTDFYPTLLELAELRKRPRQHVDGTSLVPLLRGRPLDRKPLFWHYPHYGNQGGAPGAAIREGSWKLIRWYENGATELYNLANDAGERYDLSELVPDRAARLGETLDQWLNDVGANMPSANPRYSATRPSGRLPPDER